MKKLIKKLSAALAFSLIICSVLWSTSYSALGVDVVNPIDYMVNTSGYTLRDPNTGDVQKTVTSGDKIFYQKNPSDGRRYEKYRYDEEYVWLERDTTWPDYDSPNGSNAYDMAPYGSGKLAKTYNWTVGDSFTTNTTVQGFNFKPELGQTGVYKGGAATYDWPITRKLVYHNAAYNMGGDLGTVDVIVIQTTTTGAPDNPYVPRGAERHWYVRGYGFVKWQNWTDFTTDPNFNNITAATPTRSVTMNRKNGSVPALSEVCPDLFPVGTPVYQVHQQNYGWLGWVYQGAVGGVTGQSLRSEAFQLWAHGNVNLTYRSYVEGLGWQSWVTNGAICGTTGQNRAIQGIQVTMSNAPAGYVVQYRAHVQNYGWMAWVSSGQTAGLPGQGLRIEAMEFRVIKP